MCFELDSLPPIPVVRGASVSHEDLVLEAADGNRFAAFIAAPEQPAATGIVVLPDVRGLYRFYEELALRFAERGYAALAIDYFGRTAGVDKRGDDFPYPDTSRRRRRPGSRPTSRAAVERLRAEGRRGGLHGRLLLRRPNSWLAAAAGHGLAGAVGFYGRPGERQGHARRPPRGRDDGADPGAPGR